MKIITALIFLPALLTESLASIRDRHATDDGTSSRSKRSPSPRVASRRSPSPQIIRGIDNEDLDTILRYWGRPLEWPTHDERFGPSRRSPSPPNINRIDLNGEGAHQAKLPSRMTDNGVEMSELEHDRGDQEEDEAEAKCHDAIMRAVEWQREHKMPLILVPLPTGPIFLAKKPDGSGSSSGQLD